MPSAGARSRLHRSDLRVCLNYLAIVRVEAGEPDGLQTMRNRSRWRRRGTTRRPRAYCNLAELLLRMGRLDELERCVREGLTFTRERGFWSHAYNLEVHRCLLLLRRGDWDGASKLLARSPTRRDVRLQRAVARPAARRGAGDRVRGRG